MKDKLLKFFVYASALLTVTILGFIIFHIMAKGLPYITPNLFSLEYSSENLSLMPSFVTTIMLCILSLFIAIPFGVFTAVYLIEYASKKNRFVNIIRVTCETLAGIPSIVYGLFGMLFFVTYLKWGFSILAGAFTLAIMIMPAIMRTTEEALKSVPESYREGAFALGAGKMRTIFRIILPAAMPGILAGVILASGRIVGETAALIYTAGTVAKIPEEVFSSGRTLAVHMYALSSEGFHTNEAYATAVVLLGLVLFLNTLSGLAAKKLAKE